MWKAFGPIRAGLAVIGLGTTVFAASAARASETINYVYDARGRLVQVVRSGSVNNGVMTSYTIDKADNRTSKSTSGSGNPPPP